MDVSGGRHLTFGVECDSVVNSTSEVFDDVDGGIHVSLGWIVVVGSQEGSN